MREVLEFQGRIKPAIELAASFARAETGVTAIQDVVYCLQMATYWLKEAADHMYSVQVSTDDLESPVEGNQVFPPETPVVNQSPIMLIVIFDILNKLMLELYSYSTERGMDKFSNYLLTSAITRINEAKYSVIIAKLQYERLQTAGKLN
jgi:hypothetical protein